MKNKRDEKRRLSFKLNQIKRLFFKYLRTTQNPPLIHTPDSSLHLHDLHREAPLSQIADQLIARLPKSSSPQRLKNRCLLTGRSKAVLRQFRLSRFSLKKEELPGLYKASW